MAEKGLYLLSVLYIGGAVWGLTTRSLFWCIDKIPKIPAFLRALVRFAIGCMVIVFSFKITVAAGAYLYHIETVSKWLYGMSWYSLLVGVFVWYVAHTDS